MVSLVLFLLPFCIAYISPALCFNLELDEIVSTQCDSEDRIDNALRSYLNFTTKYKGPSHTYLPGISKSHTDLPPTSRGLPPFRLRHIALLVQASLLDTLSRSCGLRAKTDHLQSVAGR